MTRNTVTENKINFFSGLNVEEKCGLTQEDLCKTENTDDSFMGSILCYDKNVALKDIMLTLKKKNS